MRRQIGIMTFDDLELRCYVDPETKHWHYRGAFTRQASGATTPTMWYPPLQRAISVAKAIGLINATAPGAGRLWFRACGCWDCANPAHHKIGTRSQMIKLARKSNTPLHNAQISAAYRLRAGIAAPALAAGASIFNLGSTL